MNNFQRTGATSNTHVGKDFEVKAKVFFAGQGIQLKPNVSLKIGINATPKPHNFDLGNRDEKIIVECKSHTWTAGGNVPSAKMTTWNQAMYFFYAAPADYRKILFVLKDFNKKKDETLGEYYVRTYHHLIPENVEIWEFDESNSTGNRIR